MKLKHQLFYFLFIIISTPIIAQKQANNGKHLDSAKHRIRGIVTVWKSKTAISGVLVMTRGAKKEETMRGVDSIVNGVGVQTDSCGRFELFLPDSMIGKKLTLLFYKNHYLSKTIEVKTWKLPAKVKIQMEEYSSPSIVRFL